MDAGLIEGFLRLVEQNAGWLIACAGLFAFVDALAVIGLFLPGTVLMFVIGAAAGGNMSLFVGCWLAAFAGALASDGSSWWLGRRYRHRMEGWPLLRSRPELLARARQMVLDHGAKGVFLGRMIGLVRPFSALIAGAMDMRGRSLLAASVPACLVWAPLYMLPGLLFGASLELAAEFAGRLAMVLAVVVIGLWLVVWSTRLVYQFSARRSRWWLKGLIRRLGRHPRLGRLLAPLFGVGPGRRELISIAFLGLLLMLCLAVLLGAFMLTPFLAGTMDAERQFASMAASLRNHLADPVMVVVALAGEPRALALTAAVLTLVMAGTGRFNAAVHWLAAVAGGWVLATMLGGLFGLVSPADAARMQIPHRGLALATVTLGFFAVMIAKDLRAARRKWPYLVSSGLLALIAFANFYLGRVSALGLIAALALGGGWAALVGIGYRQRSTQRRRPLVLALLFYGLIVAGAVVQANSRYSTLMEETRLVPQARLLSSQAWRRGGWQQLPMRYSRLGREALDRFDFQYAGSRDWLARQLQASGWQRPTSQTIVPAQLFSARPSADRLPHLPRDFAGHPEDLIMFRARADGRHEVLRLWASGARLVPEMQPVWLGQVRIEKIGSAFGLLNRWRDACQPALAAEALNQSLGQEMAPVGNDGLYLISQPLPDPKD